MDLSNPDPNFKLRKFLIFAIWPSGVANTMTDRRNRILDNLMEILQMLTFSP